MKLIKTNTMKRATIVMAALMISSAAFSQGFTTGGDGTQYSFEKLSTIAGSGVTRDGNAYIVSVMDTIAAGDSFKIDEGVTVRFDDGAGLVIEGQADLRCGNGRTLLSLADKGESDGISVSNALGITEVSNLDFEYVGLRNYSPTGMNVSDCTFSKHLGGVSSALFLGTDGASFHVSNCQFAECQKSAIGGAANFLCNAVIENCTFTNNSQANRNIPQINLTTAPSIEIRNSVVEGDSTLNMVGGIAIANWYGTSGNKATIEGCTIKDNRYGITTMGVMDVVIKDNQIVNNKFETNPNNGGSGISLYDPYGKQTVMLSGNYIERSLWGITVIGCGEVNLGKTTVDASAPDYNPGGNTFKDNGNNGVLYDLYNNSANTIYAQGNVWNCAVQDSVSIEQVIFHKNDLSSLGEVIFMPASTPEGVRTVTVSHQAADSGVYDLFGRKIRNEGILPKGIYIINGKKIVRK